MQRATDGHRLRPFVTPALTDVTVSPPVVIEATSAHPTRSWRTVLPVVAVSLCILLGVGLRVAAYARNQSLWIDEAMLALNVVHRTTAELFQPLDLNQGAPVGYLLLSKLAVRAFGPGELALRLVSIIAGLAGLAVFVPLAYRALPTGAARLAVCLFALSPYLVGYSAEFKQYELDATVAVVLMALGLPLWRNTAGPRVLVAMALAGAAAVWFSHPSVFVLGGVGLAFLADAAIRRDRGALAVRLAVVGAWLASFGACYWFCLRKLGTNDFLLEYWAGTFMPLPPTRPGDFAWIVHHFLAFFEKPVGLNPSEFGAGGLAAACFLVAALALLRSDWRLLVALVAPLGLAMLASGLQKYPFAGRLLLFAVPAALLMVAYGAAVVAQRLRHAVPGAAIVLVGLLFVAPVAECYWHTKRSIHAEDAREVLAHVHANWQPGDRAYMFYGATPAYSYYAPRYPIPKPAIVFGAPNRGGDQQVFQRELALLRGSPRVWVIIAHRQTTEETAIQAYLDGMGRCEEELRLTDALVLRYDLSGK
jgi:hypothetical protein